MNGLTPEERAEVYERALAIHNVTGRPLEAIMYGLSSCYPAARQQAAESRERWAAHR